MYSAPKLLLSIFTASAALLAVASPLGEDGRSTGSAAAACALVAAKKNLQPAFAGSLQYANDISHWSNASSLPALCSVEPDTPEEVQQLFDIIKRTRTPWAVKGMGHCNINGMSSTYGLQIAMSRFNKIEVSRDKKSVKLGTGLQWAEVYEALDRHNLIVVGGRAPTVGVAGLTLSAGYAWHTNEYGFAVDNILAADIVLPNGTFTTVSEKHGGDIFRGLQGGVNNFGIVTSVTLRAFPTTKVWGGTLTVSGDLTGFINVLADWAASGNPEAHPKAILDAQYFANNGTVTGGIILFYNGPKPPRGLFDAVINLPNSTNNFKTQSFVDFVKSSGEVPTDPGNRATWYSAPIKPTGWTRELITYIRDQVAEYSRKVVQNGRSGGPALATMAPYGSQAYGFSQGSAWPHSRENPYNTFSSLFTWKNAKDDKIMFDLIVDFNNGVWNKAIQTGASRPKGQVFYPPNYSQGITPVEQIYGPNLPWLRQVKRNVDPYNLISLTGGFQI